MTTIEIDGRAIGADAPPFVIAEIGMNHNGELALGKEMIASAADAGADAVKFQSFRTDQFLSDKVGNKEQYREYELSPADHEALQAEAQSQGVAFISTPFDRPSVDLLDDLGVPCFKVASSDLTNYPFLEYIAQKGKPMVLSTGYSTASEVATAVERIRDTGNEQLVLLHCVSVYPTPPTEMNLRAMETLREMFDVDVGLSDHTQFSPVAPISATALGASVIEKHFTTDNELPGFDHGMAENPESFTKVVEQIQTTHEALGSGTKQPHEEELESRESACRSLFWDGSFSKGEIIDEAMLSSLRPGDGIPPARIDEVCERALATDVEEGEKVAFDQIDWSN